MGDVFCFSHIGTPFFTIVTANVRTVPNHWAEFSEKHKCSIRLRQSVFNAYPFAANVFIWFNLIYSSKSIKNPCSNWRVLFKRQMFANAPLSDCF